MTSPTGLSASFAEAVDELTALVARLRPASPHDIAVAEVNIYAEAERLKQQPETAQRIQAALSRLLAVDGQASLYAEAGVRSALGFALELSHRFGARVLPAAPQEGQLRDALREIFYEPNDHLWVEQVTDESWLVLFNALPPLAASHSIAAIFPILEAIRVLSYRLAGAALDRELLRAEPALERFESPFLAQNVELLPLLERERTESDLVFQRDFEHMGVLLDQCFIVLDRVRRRAKTQGISIRLTYLLARLEQLTHRLVLLLKFLAADDRSQPAVTLFKVLVRGEKTRNHLTFFIGENISLLARNVTDHASRHGEHYIAGDRQEWFAMFRSAAGGGVVIACMAMVKIQLGLLHLPPLTEGLVFGLNYALGFLLIYLLGFTVATKQPAMTAAAIAATLEESQPKDLERLVSLVRNVCSTQFVAIAGNVMLAVPVAILLAYVWPFIFAHAAAPVAKAQHLLADIHPFASGALWFAAVAGVGLFLSGIVSGYFDNQARYHKLAERIGAQPLIRAVLGVERAHRLGIYLDEHHGAILGNLFFGMYLGLMGSVTVLTGLPIDIRHVAFSSANVGTAWVLEGYAIPWQILGVSVFGVVAIALVNLLVSFSLALYVAMRSRRLGFAQLVRLGFVLAGEFVRKPWTFIFPPKNLPTPGDDKLPEKATQSQ